MRVDDKTVNLLCWKRIMQSQSTYLFSPAFIKKLVLALPIIGALLVMNRLGW